MFFFIQKIQKKHHDLVGMYLFSYVFILFQFILKAKSKRKKNGKNKKNVDSRKKSPPRFEDVCFFSQFFHGGGGRSILKG